MTEYNTERKESTLTKCPIICSVLLWWPKYSCLGLSWCDPSIAALVCLDECLLIYSVVPPSLHWRGPDSVKCDAPSLVSVCRSSIQSLHLDNNGKHAWAPLFYDLTTETEEPSVFLPFYTRSAPGWQGRARWCAPCPLLRAADDSLRQESVEEDQVTVLPLGHLRWSKQPQDMFPGHKHTPQVLLHTWWDYTTVFNRNYILLENSGDYGCSSIRGVFESQ